ncbi:MAG: alkaline phosphatase D family protein [Bacteroidia bacterium]|nr:alkaline phosphatase D family protein [Bacteroidia bacterium]
MKSPLILIAALLLFLPKIEFAQVTPAKLYPFLHGVASGDPESDRVIIWTRISDQQNPVSVNWKMGLDTAITTVVASGTATTDSFSDYTLKLDVTGLQPDTWYFYQFEFGGRKSLIGRTKTLPVGNNEHLRLAIASCARVNLGAYYTTYNSMALRNDLHGIIHVGDYIYETQGSLTGRGVQVLPLGTAYSLQGYRYRYNTYKLDLDLIRLHQQYPFFNSWDDHETANDSWKDGAEAHDSLTQGPWAVRKAAGQQAFFEWLPIRSHPQDTFRSYRSFHLGDLADLIMLDTRLEGRDLQASLLDQTAYADTNRTILGFPQMAWLKNELSNSTAKWKILGNQVMFAPLQLFGIAFSYDQWDGYQADRNRIIDHVMGDTIQNVVLVTGDIHTSWACDIPIPGQSYNPNTGAGSAFVEFIGPSVTTGSSVTAPRRRHQPGQSPHQVCGPGKRRVFYPGP